MGALVVLCHARTVHRRDFAAGLRIGVDAVPDGGGELRHDGVLVGVHLRPLLLGARRVGLLGLRPLGGAAPAGLGLVGEVLAPPAAELLRSGAGVDLVVLVVLVGLLVLAHAHFLQHLVDCADHPAQMRGTLGQQAALALQVLPGVAVTVDKLADLRQGQPDFPVHQDQLRPLEVVVDVKPVPAERAPRRHQEIDGLPMPQRAHGDSEQLGGLADGQLGAVAFVGRVSHEPNSIT